MRLAYVFPGQGAQYVGMGKELADLYSVAKATFKSADDVLQYSLGQLCFEGPEEQLRLTYHTQPALLTTSLAAYRVFVERTAGIAQIEPVVMAGHSLGEYSALVASGSLAFEDALPLVERRGRFMDEASPAGVGAMAAVLGMEEADLAEVCREASDGSDIVELANLNCPGQIVISGTAPAVERAGELARARGAKRVIPLVVSGPFHCQLMSPAADKLSEALNQTSFQNARVPVVANVDAEARTDAEGLRSVLAPQVYRPVRWADDVRTMAGLGVDAFVEFGPGTVLSGLIKKVVKGIPVYHVENETSLNETLNALCG